MAEASSKLIGKKYAVVTGANKGIGLEICRQLASHGITVVLTARDETRGIEAFEKLKCTSGLFSGYLIFHQLDVTGASSVSALVGFIKSEFGKLDILYIPNEWAKKARSNAHGEEIIEQVLNKFLKDFKDGNLKAKMWPSFLSAYTLSKAAMNAYTRIIAKKYPAFRINSVCPGYVKTDNNCNTGILTVEDGAQSIVRLALIRGGPK